MVSCGVQNKERPAGYNFSNHKGTTDTMSFKGFILRSLQSIPHLSLLLDRRIQHRFEPREGIDIKISGSDAMIHGHMLDISRGGMRVISTDERIEDLDSIELSVDDFTIELPCKAIRKVGPYYGISFGELEKSVGENLTEFLDRFMDKPSIFLATVGR